MSTRILCKRSSKANVNNVLTFTAVENNSAIKLTKVGSPSAVSLLYSLNGSSWTDYNIDDIITLNNTGNYVSFKGTTNTFSKNYNNYYKFAMSGKISAAGNTNSLINYSSLTDYCYYGTFSNCTSLTTAPQLPATNLTFQCYNRMFQNCTSLIKAPQLPATNLINYCYAYMFSNCTSLTTAPQLPASSLTRACYRGMFSNCTSLTTAPQLPASSLAQACYNCMFQECINLIQAPQLPATTLVNDCYAYMFQNCTSLTTAPQLPATTLTKYCYRGMFNHCTSLSSINVNFIDWNISNESTKDWLLYVNSTGTFTCPIDLLQQRGSDYIPEDWTRQNKELTFTAIEDNSAVQLIKYGSPDNVSLQYSLNNGSWNDYSLSTIINLNTNNKVSFKGTTTTFSKNSFNYYKFIMSGKISAAGNTNSLINYSSLTNYCYYSMFSNCTSLTTAPQLPASILASYCYNSMFSNCTNLIEAPQLPAASLPYCYYCYAGMFLNCTSLVTTKNIYITNNYSSKQFLEWMFKNTALSALYLPNTTYTEFINGGYHNLMQSSQKVTVYCSDKTFEYSNWYHCCFVAGTKILTSLNGQTKNIEDFNVGQTVISYNFETKENYEAIVTKLIVHDNTTDIAKITLQNDNTVQFNAYHPIYTQQGWKSLTNYNNYNTLVEGDNVKVLNGQYSKLIKIQRYISQPILTYNLCVKDKTEIQHDDDINDNYYANNILVHNEPC